MFTTKYFLLRGLSGEEQKAYVATCSEAGVDTGVAYDRQCPVAERMSSFPAVKVEVASVLGVDGDRGVAEHRLGTSRRNADFVIYTYTLLNLQRTINGYNTPKEKNMKKNIETG